jgi:hypothetical protein
MTFLSPSQWLSQFLKYRELNFVSGNSLFSYQMTLDEYNHLKEIVVTYEPKTNLNIKHKEWCACFVIFCSEWYRRLYQPENGWSWSGIWDELDFEKKDNSQLKEILKLGLEGYWKRPILRYTAKRNFLGSVFSEGGLPFQLISKSDNNFGYMMHKVLRDFYQVELFRISLQDIIRRNVDYLPSAFQKEESIELIAEIINQLMQLVKIHNLDSIEDTKPSVYLDKAVPEWRSHFPIPLDNNTGNELLDNWLSNATKATGSIKKHRALLTCNHYLSLPNLVFRSEVILPNTLEFDFKKSDVNSARIDIDIYEGDKSAGYLGGSYAQFDNNCTKVRPKQKGIKLKRTNLDKFLSIVASDAGKYLEGKDIENSAIQLGEVPLGFSEKNGTFQLIGQASFSTKKEIIYLLLPEDFEVEVILGSCDLENTFQGYHWYKANGDLRCISGEHIYRVSTNKSIDTSGMISLSGDEIMWGTKPSLVYKGIPKFNINSDIPVSKYDFTSFINNKNIQSLSNSQKYGRHTFTVKNKDNDILLKRSVGILPDDFDIAFKPGTKVSEGKVIVTSSENAIYSLEADGVEVLTTKLPNGMEFLLSADDLPPVNVSLTVLANLMSNPIQIDLPFPAAGIYAFNKDNVPLAFDVSVEDLIGSRLYLYSSSLTSESFNIELALMPQGRSTPNYSWDVRVDDKPVEINLYTYKDRINELMSLGALDATVRLTIKGKRRNIKTFNIRRHSHMLDIEYQMHTVGLKGDASLKHMFDDTFRPMAMLISEPESSPLLLEPKLVEGMNVGIFEIPSLMDKEGPWLIVPQPDSNATFRAGFYSNYEKEELSEIKDIKAAIEQFSFHNPKTISTFIQQIESEPQNHNWNYFVKLWQKFSYLPLPTFNAWSDLVKNHKALALLLLKMEMDERLVQRIDREFTIIWEIISPKVWIEAKHSFANYLLSVGVAEDMCSNIINGLFDKLHQALPNYPQEVIDYIKTEQMPTLMPTPVMEHVISGWIQDLIRDNSDAIWPQRFEGRLLKWLNQRPEIKKYLNIPNSYQFPVAILPIVCASIAAEDTRISELFVFDHETLFNIKLTRDFDHNWFNPVYSYFLNLFLLDR